MKFYNVGLRRKLNIKVEGRTDIRVERERKKRECMVFSVKRRDIEIFVDTESKRIAVIVQGGGRRQDLKKGERRLC